MTFEQPAQLHPVPDLLYHGTHHSPEHGMCMMEAAAYVAGEPHTDHPRCVSAVIGQFCRVWNDDLGSTMNRDRLRKWVPRVIGTNGSHEVELQRMLLVAEWLMGTAVPTWLDYADCHETGEVWRASPVDCDGYVQALDALRKTALASTPTRESYSQSRAFRMPAQGLLNRSAVSAAECVLANDMFGFDLPLQYWSGISIRLKDILCGYMQDSGRMANEMQGPVLLLQNSAEELLGGLIAAG